MTLHHTFDSSAFESEESPSLTVAPWPSDLEREPVCESHFRDFILLRENPCSFKAPHDAINK